MPRVKPSAPRAIDQSAGVLSRSTRRPADNLATKQARAPRAPDCAGKGVAPSSLVVILEHKAMPAKKSAPARSSKKKLLLVDDHPMMRGGLAQAINEQTDLRVCA